LSAIQFDIGVEAKYPFQILRNCYLSPAIGMKYMYLVSGNVGGQSPTTDMAQLLNPLFFTLGGDLDYYFHANYFLRVNYTVGIGLNAKLSDSFYSPGTYVSSSSILNSVGVSFGCALD